MIFKQRVMSFLIMQFDNNNKKIEAKYSRSSKMSSIFDFCYTPSSPLYNTYIYVAVLQLLCHNAARLQSCFFFLFIAWSFFYFYFFTFYPCFYLYQLCVENEIFDQPFPQVKISLCIWCVQCDISQLFYFTNMSFNNVSVIYVYVFQAGLKLRLLPGVFEARWLNLCNTNMSLRLRQLFFKNIYLGRRHWAKDYWRIFYFLQIRDGWNAFALPSLFKLHTISCLDSNVFPSSFVFSLKHICLPCFWRIQKSSNLWVAHEGSNFGPASRDHVVHLFSVIPLLSSVPPCRESAPARPPPKSQWINPCGCKSTA